MSADNECQGNRNGFQQKGVRSTRCGDHLDVMDFAADFTAIDFETASRRADSACQLAAVIVRGGRIVDQAKWLIRPIPFYFSQANIRIHGITPQQVRDEPTFAELWPEIAETIGDDCLVAHNASFDLGVLLACLRAHDLAVPEVHFTCTRAIARRTWPHHRRYGLKPLSNWLGIRFRHHDALEDSIACAKILLAAGIDREASSLSDLEKRLKLSRGKAGPWGRKTPIGTTRRRPATSTTELDRSTPLPFLFPDQTSRVASAAAAYQSAEVVPTIDLQRLMIRAEFIRPLLGKQIAFSGRLQSLTRDQAEALATQLGGCCQSSVDESVDLFVVGAKGRQTVDLSASADAEERRAAELASSGNPIKIVAEDEFLGLVVAPGDQSPTDAPSRTPPK